MIYTVFPCGVDENELPQDFGTLEEALESAQDNYTDFEIESTEGTCIN